MQVERNALGADVEKQARASRIRGVGEMHESENVVDAGAFSVGVACRGRSLASEVGIWKKATTRLERKSLANIQTAGQQCQTSTRVADGGMPESE